MNILAPVELISTVDFNGNHRTYRVRIDNDNGRFITGFQVAPDHARTDKYHVIDISTIVKRTPVRINHRYGTEEPVK